MSSHEAWQIIDAFRELEEPTPEDIVELDLAMARLLRDLKSNRHCRAAGLSSRFPRFQDSYPDRTPAEELGILRNHYWARHRQLEDLNRNIESKQLAFERSCTHEWERDLTSRDHRSRYQCKYCGAYR
jgi:hypothetical protein